MCVFVVRVRTWLIPIVRVTGKGEEMRSVFQQARFMTTTLKLFSIDKSLVTGSLKARDTGR